MDSAVKEQGFRRFIAHRAVNRGNWIWTSDDDNIPQEVSIRLSKALHINHTVHGY